MWYFTWILGVLLAVGFGILNGIWHELQLADAGDSGEDEM
ncbi:cytochrome bd-I oxidase subunit CydX [Caulobacter sp. NIBR1757]|nr:cytochrome bd-I oxidase subunit CydX [Caulobacter sp. NIBR1757]WGM37659.1 hypothetical protein AMEJIAPC_00558 [Caulobacter sp. NIBR1757]